MHLNENGSQGGTRRTEEEARAAEFRDNLQRWLHNAVAVLREEVPTEAWPRVAARLEGVGLLLPMSDDDSEESGA